ncbi:hypothetical protein VCUG_01987 [Vavraia culicis subsp. floridensis]|uniref:Uncharacterized protein n=1 Tax=Vavraia culicis (isolate floridensis) TaxID=948595 RepID=L2GSE8_VAVCU|nr:uncharacterized protein VCUG_01987 [Vavraia culicis subsp. floridensis]ELA46554.1 hypothetical protein VCUG_01987 [Vavraia culicis subsp. floridensis]
MVHVNNIISLNECSEHKERMFDIGIAMENSLANCNSLYREARYGAMRGDRRENNKEYYDSCRDNRECSVTCDDASYDIIRCDRRSSIGNVERSNHQNDLKVRDECASLVTCRVTQRKNNSPHNDRNDCGCVSWDELFSYGTRTKSLEQDEEGVISAIRTQSVRVDAHEQAIDDEMVTIAGILLSLGR